MKWVLIPRSLGVSCKIRYLDGGLILRPQPRRDHSAGQVLTTS